MNPEKNLKKYFFYISYIFLQKYIIINPVKICLYCLKKRVNMYKIIYIGNNEKFDLGAVSSNLTTISNYNINFLRENCTDLAVNHFYTAEPVILLIGEESCQGLIKLIEEIKSDESFELLPIFLVLDENTPSQRKKYFAKGMDGFLSKNFDTEELILTCNSAIKNKIRVDQVVRQLGEVSEKNITKAIQLDLIRKFIPQTVWIKSESLAEGQSLEIPEEEQELAIIFGDLQSFTTHSEKMSPKEVVEMLNGVFDITTQIIYQNFGDIDKFIGDAFLAVFDSPEMAALSAIMIQEELENYNKNRESKGLFVTSFRMGVHYGRVIRGSVGGTVRFDNTLIGDPINTAERLESLSAAGDILASKTFISRIPAIDIDKINFVNYTLKGKNKNVEACQLYSFYKTNVEIKKILFKNRFEIERSRKTDD
jgi:adenylate cyclase